MTSTAIETKPSSIVTEDVGITKRGRYGEYHEPLAESSPVMQRIVAEICSFNPAKAAVMLQIANPGVGKGVHDHSSFTLRPVERSRRSLFYIYVMCFGTLAERRKVTDATHRAHMRVKKDGKAGYDANDVDLQLWVAATIYWSLILGYEDVLGKLDDDTADQAYREFSIMATGLRVPPEKWPKDRLAFQKYWDSTIKSLEITPEAKAVSVDLLWPTKNLPWGLWVLTKFTGPIQRFTTIELLPERIRNDFGYPSTPYTRFMYWFRKAVDRRVYPWMPLFLRHFVMKHSMAEFRYRLAKGLRM